MPDATNVDTPETEEEYQERKKALIEDAAKTKAKLEEKQNEALQAISEGGDLEKYEVVELGELELEVKAWLPGDTTETVQEAQRLAEEENIRAIKRSMQTFLSALADMTVDDTYDLQFWRKYYQRYGPEGMIVAVEAVLGPAGDSLEKQKQGAESFRSDEQRDGFRPGKSDDRLPPEDNSSDGGP
jgi:transcriptional regulator of NAD metabolism